jgi:hypothetical protein
MRTITSSVRQARFWLALFLIRLARRLVEPLPVANFDPEASRLIDQTVDVEDRFP